jgi:hypothetical protein
MITTVGHHSKSVERNAIAMEGRHSAALFMLTQNMPANKISNDMFDQLVIQLQIMSNHPQRYPEMIAFIPQLP